MKKNKKLFLFDKLFSWHLNTKDGNRLNKYSIICEKFLIVGLLKKKVADNFLKLTKFLSKVIKNKYLRIFLNHNI